VTMHRTVADGLGHLTLDHPPVNVLTRSVLGELRDALATLADEPALRAVLLDARGKHFSAGADVGEHMPPEFRDLIPEFLATIGALAAFPLPTVAAVRGRCVGGGLELVLGVDIVIASDTARFGQPEIALGVVPPVACALLPRRCPAGVAAEIVFTGDLLNAEDAYAAGLVRRVVPDAELDSVALELTSRITRHSGAALRAAKRALRAAFAEHDARAMTAAGSTYVDDVMTTADALEGLNAFLEKRQPTWSHR